MLPLRYDNPKEVYTLVEDTLQILSAIATSATFFRVIEEHELSKIFLILPMLLFAFFIARKHPALKQDIHTMAMLAGAATGINSGFLSSIVTEHSWKHPVKDISDNVIGPQVTKTMMLRHLEFLHLPVIFGSMLYSYCIVFDRLPSRQSTRLAASTALCGAVMITLTTTFGDQRQGVMDVLLIFMSMFLLAFLVGMIPVIKVYQRPWMICVMIFILCIYWEKFHFDTLVWNWEECRYPIPGCITAMTVVLLLNVHESGDTKVVTSAENLISKDKILDSNGNGPEVIDIREVLMNAFAWHGVTYVIERISLAFIKGSKKHHADMLPQSPHGSDVWISCVTMIAYVGVMSTHFKATNNHKLALVLSGLLLYVSVTLSVGVLSNAYFIDMIFGLTIVYFCHNKYYSF